MALFGSKKKEAKQEVAATKPEASGRVASYAHVLKHARITEKATMNQGIQVYTFDVETSATKRDIIQAVRALYKVTPRKVTVVTVPKKVRRNMRTGHVGVLSGGKKAYVFLKAGETITIA